MGLNNLLFLFDNVVVIFLYEGILVKRILSFMWDEVGDTICRLLAIMLNYKTGGYTFTYFFVLEDIY